MNTSKRFTMTVLALSLLAGLTALAPNATAGPGDPVCSPTRDVTSVLGRSAGNADSVHCLIERKVTAIVGSQDVSTIMGNGPRYFDGPRHESTVVASRDLKNSPVELILGRSGYPYPATSIGAESAIAKSAQE